MAIEGCVGENAWMRRIEVKQLEYDLTPVGGLALVGRYLEAMAPQWAKLGAALPVQSGVSNSSIVRAYLVLLVQGKSDFYAIEGTGATSFSNKRWGSGCWRRARRCASGWTRRRRR